MHDHSIAPNCHSHPFCVIQGQGHRGRALDVAVVAVVAIAEAGQKEIVVVAIAEAGQK